MNSDSSFISPLNNLSMLCLGALSRARREWMLLELTALSSAVAEISELLISVASMDHCRSLYPLGDC